MHCFKSIVTVSFLAFAAGTFAAPQSASSKLQARQWGGYYGGYGDFDNNFELNDNFNNNQNNNVNNNNNLNLQEVSPGAAGSPEVESDVARSDAVSNGGDTIPKDAAIVDIDIPGPAVLVIPEGAPVDDPPLTIDEGGVEAGDIAGASNNADEAAPEGQSLWGGWGWGGWGGNWGWNNDNNFDFNTNNNLNNNLNNNINNNNNDNIHI